MKKAVIVYELRPKDIPGNTSLLGDLPNSLFAEHFFVFGAKQIDFESQSPFDSLPFRAGVKAAWRNLKTLCRGYPPPSPIFHRVEMITKDGSRRRTPVRLQYLET